MASRERTVKAESNCWVTDVQDGGDGNVVLKLRFNSRGTKHVTYYLAELPISIHHLAMTVDRVRKVANEQVIRAAQRRDALGVVRQCVPHNQN